MIILKSIVFGNNICAILYWYWISFRLLINVFAHTFYFVLSKYFTDMLWFIFQICHNNVKYIYIYMSYCPSHDTDWKINEKTIMIFIWSHRYVICMLLQDKHEDLILKIVNSSYSAYVWNLFTLPYKRVVFLCVVKKKVWYRMMFSKMTKILRKKSPSCTLNTW